MDDPNALVDVAPPNALLVAGIADFASCPKGFIDLAGLAPNAEVRAAVEEELIGVAALNGFAKLPEAEVTEEPNTLDEPNAGAGVGSLEKADIPGVPLEIDPKTFDGGFETAEVENEEAGEVAPPTKGLGVELAPNIVSSDHLEN